MGIVLFKFRSRTHGMNEELGRHRDRGGRVEYMLCGAECESVVHMLWECSCYSTCRHNFREALKQLLGATYVQFKRLTCCGSFILIAIFRKCSNNCKMLDMWNSKGLVLWKKRMCSVAKTGATTSTL